MEDFDFIPSYGPIYSTESTAKKIKQSDIPKTNVKISKFNKQHPIQAMVLFFIACSMIFGALSIIIYENKVITKNQETIASINRNLDTLKSENVRLRSEVKKMYSEDVVREYAEMHGMQKIDRFQIHYFESEIGDRVLLANGKATVNTKELAKKLLSN